MSATVIVRKVENDADFRAFFELPWAIYKDDPNWVPPLPSIRRETLDREKNPAWDYLEGDYYVAWRGNTPVGTIAAFVNRRHNEFHKENIAWFGFFDVYDDAEVARALLDTALEWARSRGYDAGRGPQSFTTHEECGLLVEGFAPPVVLMPYNAPYYAGHIEAAGFEGVMDTHSFYYDYVQERFEQSKEHERLTKLVKRITRNGDISVRSVDRRAMHDDFALVKALYNRAWVANWGFTPMTERELDGLVESLGMIFDPRLSAIVSVDGEPVGFMLGAPDFNQVLKAAHPRPREPEVLALLRAAWHWKIRPKIEGFRIPLMGVVEEHRKRGLDLVMYNHFMDQLKTMKRPYRHVDGGWVLETNQDMMGTLKGAGMEIYRTYRFYEKRM
jgi:GNAT superfamily N-acetyltransferase